MTPVTRHYVEVDGRLMHYRRAGHGPPVVLLHESPRSSAALLPLIGLFPDGLTVFALDTPGYGQSGALPPDRASLAHFADAVLATMRALGIVRAPVYGTHTGASIAYMVALRHPEICPLAVLDGFPVFTACEREEALASYMPPFRPIVDGTHLTWLWSRVRDQTLFFPWYRRGAAARLHLPPATPEALHAMALDMLRAGDNYRSAYAEAFRSRPLDTIADLRTRVVFGARLDDVLLPHLDRLPPGCETARFPAERPAWAAAVHRLLAKAAYGGAPALPLLETATTYADVPGGQLHVRTRAGDGATRLLLHALPGSSRSISLDDAEGPAIAPDLPGSGDSDPIEGDALDVLTALCDGRDRVEVSGSGTGALLARALHRRRPERFHLGNVDGLPVKGAMPPEVGAFAPHPVGAHLLTAWHHVRDAAILGGWERREPTPFDALDADALHAGTVELLKGRGDPAPLIRTLLEATP